MNMKNAEYPYYCTPNLKNLQDLISYCSYTFGEKTAFHYLEKDKEIVKSYRDFFEDVTAICNYLIKRGYERRHIALLGENSYEWLVFYFAIVNSNNVVVPLDKEMSVSDLSLIVRRSDSSVIVYSEDYAEEAVLNEGLDLINMKSFQNIIDENKNTDNCALDFFENVEINNNAMCAIVYTSGTTSDPKGVMLSHKNLISDALYSRMNSNIPDTSILVLPLHHTYAITIAISLPMLCGTSVFINKSLRMLMHDIMYCKPKYIAVVPLMLEIFRKKICENIKKSNKEDIINKLLIVSKLLRSIGIDLRRKLFSKIINAFGGNLELIAVGGAPINGKTVACLIDFGIAVSGGYGTSECSPIVSFVRDKHYNPYSAGTVLPGVKVRILDGEVQVKGDIVFLGYYKDEQATKEAFDGEWYKTGDIGCIENGFLFINGRKNNLIVLSNGENVSAEELELMLRNNIPEIEEVLVYNEEDIIVAEIYSPSVDSKTESKIRNDIDSINKNIPYYKQISKIIFRENDFERTTTKKIKRNH